MWGVNLPESSADVDTKNDKTGFTCDRYFEATLENIAFARKVFSKSHVVQYTNFWPCEWDNDRKYMSRAFEFAKRNRIGLGGPDIVPYKKAQMKNSYPFFNRYKGQLSLVAMAIQEPTLTYTNPETEKEVYARRIRRVRAGLPRRRRDLLDRLESLAEKLMDARRFDGVRRGAQRLSARRADSAKAWQPRPGATCAGMTRAATTEGTA